MPSYAPHYQPGRYWGKIIDHAVGQTKNGHPQIVIRFAVIGGVNPADPEGELINVGVSQERTMYRVITDKTVPYVQEDMKRLGLEGSPRQLDLNEDCAVDIRGKELAFFCKHEPTQDNSGLREVWSLAMERKPIERLDAKGLRALDAMFGKAKPPKSNGDKPAQRPEVGPGVSNSQRAAAANAADANDGSIPF
jgi:hypothetical protein